MTPGLPPDADGQIHERRSNRSRCKTTIGRGIGPCAPRRAKRPLKRCPRPPNGWKHTPTWHQEAVSYNAASAHQKLRDYREEPPETRGIQVFAEGHPIGICQKDRRSE